MNRIQQLSYEKDFHLAFVSAKGDGFQRLFEKLMQKAHPNDFITCCPWGNLGDQKNDGYLSSTRTLFQCYAPNELAAKETIKKIHEDFQGALKYWKEYFDEWAFVHNAPGGRLAPNIIKAFFELRQQNPRLKISLHGYEEMLTSFRQLSLQDLESWFGPALTMEANVNLSYSDLKLVLDHISIVAEPKTSEVKDVSRGKIEANLLSPVVAEFLKIGMRKSSLVREFFEAWRDPTYGERIASAFKAQYLTLRESTPPSSSRFDFWSA